MCSEKWRKLFSLSFGSFECVYLLYAIERARDNLYLLSTRFHYYHFVPFPAAFSPYECIILRNTLSHTHIWMKYSRTQYVLNARIFNEIRCRRILFLVCRHEEQRRGRKKKQYKFKWLHFLSYFHTWTVVNKTRNESNYYYIHFSLPPPPTNKRQCKCF